MSALVPDELKAAFDHERETTRQMAARAKDAAVLRQSTIRMYGRLAQLQERIIDTHAVRTACAPGCHHCCHLRVEVRPYEAFALARFMRDRFSPAQCEAIIARLEANLKRIAPLSSEQHIRAGIACALLEDGRCGVYEGRPAACRKYYSLSVETCRDARADPHAPLPREIEHETLRLAGNAVALGFAKGIEDAGLDAATVELHRALHAALSSDKPEKRWRDGKKAFV